MGKRLDDNLRILCGVLRLADCEIHAAFMQRSWDIPPVEIQDSRMQLGMLGEQSPHGFAQPCLGNNRSDANRQLAQVQALEQRDVAPLGFRARDADVCRQAGVADRS